MKLGRNDPCHCGSGQKYKKCHQAEDDAKKSAELQAQAATRAAEAAAKAEAEEAEGEGEGKDAAAIKTKHAQAKAPRPQHRPAAPNSSNPSLPRRGAV